MSKKILAAIICSITITSPASAMTAAEFLTKANKLQKMGPAALMSSDMKLLRQEGESAGKYYRNMICKKQRKNGGTLHSCPPKKGSMNSGEANFALASHACSTAAKHFLPKCVPDVYEKEISLLRLLTSSETYFQT